MISLFALATILVYGDGLVLPPMAMVPMMLMEAHARYLAGTFGTMRHEGCFEVTVTGTVIKDMLDVSGSTSCAGVRCPPCFILSTDVGVMDLVIHNCDKDIFSTVFQTTMLTNFQFTNVGGHAATISDADGNTYILTSQGRRGSSMECNCFGGQLSCDASVTPVMLEAPFTQSMLGFHGCATITASMTLPVSGTDRRRTSCGSSEAPHVPGGTAGCAIDMGSKQGLYTYPPQCFRLDTTGGDVSVQIDNCHIFGGIQGNSGGEYVRRRRSDDNEDNGRQNVVIIHLVNTGNQIARISDGTNIYKLYPQGGGTSACICYCHSFTSKMSCSAPAPTVEDTVMSGSMGFGSSDNTIEYDANNGGLVFAVAAIRAISMIDGEGVMHGYWFLENSLSYSDKRLKKNIEPLSKALLRSHTNKYPQNPMESSSSVVENILEQLQPVSYSLKADKHNLTRFGFIADDLQEVLSQLVHTKEDEAKMLAVHYDDFFALLVVAVQNQHRSIGELQLAVGKLEADAQTDHQKLEEMQRHLSELEAYVDNVTNISNVLNI